MRSHQFELDPHRSAEANVRRLQYYVRSRFGKGVMPKKGKAARARQFRRLLRKFPGSRR